MEYNCQNMGDSLAVTMNGKLTFEDQQLFRAMIGELTDASAAKWVIDLTNLEFIDSAGLGLLLRVKATSDKQNRQLSLRVPADGHVRKMLDISRFDQMIPFET